MTRTGPVLVALATTLVGCGGPREAGPSESEFGKYFYWEVASGDISWGEDCSDDPDLRDGVNLAPPDAGSFLMYRVSADGKTAAAQTCSTTDASSCTASESGIVYDIAGHTLTFEGNTTNTDVGADCQQHVVEVWTLVDNGETLDWTTDLEFSLIGNTTECNMIDDAVAADSPNGKGIDGCVFSLSVSADFYSAQ